MARLLVFEPRMLGDAILSLPFVRGAMEQHEVTVCCLPKTAPIYRWILPPERIIEWEVPWDCAKPAREKWTDFRRVTQQIRALHFDTVVSVWPDARVHIWMALLGIPQRISFPMTRLNYVGWQRPWRGRQLQLGKVLEWIGAIGLLRPLLTRKLSKHDSNQRHWMNWQQIAEALDTPWRAETPWLPTDPSTLAPDFTQFIQQERALGRPIWMVHPGARMANRRWAPERFQQILDNYFPAHGISVVVLRPPDSPALDVRCGHQLDYAAGSLTELAAATAQVDGVLCNDSMMMHLAAALGCRVVPLFSAGGRGWFAPFQNDEFIAYVDICPHCPCLDRCLMPSPICIEQLGVDIVQQKLDLALATHK
ncbi:MAG: hypothetical protein B9S32_10225 [Verrucomicrobia bacterium Tous-C9LFEB]|nr:MAG: hypothetical protein B9S32_10225 [Verrucomicrobia bacterium Tous-C9LFEB]